MSSTLTTQIKAEWNILRAFVANNQILSLAIALGVAWTAGHFHLPI